MSMTPEELSRLRELCELATPGPWEVDSKTHPAIKSANGAMRIYDEGGHDYDDAEFIAASRTALPRLLDEIERLKRLQPAPSPLLIRKALLEYEDFLDRTTNHTERYCADAEYAARIYRQARHISDTLLLG